MMASFNRNVSHDLRGPIGCIASLASLAGDALNKGDVVRARGRLSMISEMAEASAKLVTALLDLASTDRAEPKRSRVDLRALVDEVVGQLSLCVAHAPRAAIRVLPLPTAMADADLLRPVFLNLIGNALKFTRNRNDGQVEIGGFSDAQHTTVFVRDNGIGFENSAALRIFEPFVRMHWRDYEGHGIGLSIVQAAIQRHGGRVWATSTPGKATTFQFTLPHEEKRARGAPCAQPHPAASAFAHTTDRAPSPV